MKISVTDLPTLLYGEWLLLRCEAPLEMATGTRMSFGRNQELEYTIPNERGVLDIVLRWQCIDGVLHTAHLDGSNPVSVRAEIGQAGELTFDFDGTRAWFIRVE